MLGSKVRFLLIVFKANLKASSSAPEGPLSMDSNIPPAGRSGKKATGKKCQFFFFAFLQQISSYKWHSRKILKIRFKQLQSEAGTSFLTLLSFCALELPPHGSVGRLTKRQIYSENEATGSRLICIPWRSLV